MRSSSAQTSAMRPAITSRPVSAAVVLRTPFTAPARTWCGKLLSTLCPGTAVARERRISACPQQEPLPVVAGIPALESGSVRPAVNGQLPRKGRSPGDAVRGRWAGGAGAGCGGLPCALACVGAADGPCSEGKPCDVGETDVRCKRRKHVRNIAGQKNILDKAIPM